MPVVELSRRRRIGVLLVCSTSLFLVGLDVTAVNVALPAIGDDLGARLSWLQWSVSAYTLVMASLLLLAGSLADRFGRRRTLIAGLTVFTAASLLCSLAPSVELLVAARVLQGVGASMLNPVAMSIVATTFTDPRERAQAVGVWGAVFGASMAAGPIVGGALVSWADWEWVFLVNVPLGAIAIGLLVRFVPESKAPTPRRFDPVAQVLVMTLLASSTYGVIELPNAGWGAPSILAALAAAVVSLAGLALYEPRREEPLVDPRFFRSIPFASAVALAVAAFASFGGFLFLNTLYLQDVRGLSPVEAGIAVVPLALMTMLLSPVSGRMVGRVGPRTPLVLAGCAFVVACCMLVRLDAATPFAWLIGAYAIFGIGFGFVNAPITNAAVSGMPAAQAGVAAALATTSRQFGHGIGVAVVGAIVAAGAGAPAGAAIATASHAAWWTLAGLGAFVLVLGTLATSGRAERSARGVAARLDPDAAAA